MGGRSISRTRKRKFHGNQHPKSKTIASDSSNVLTPSASKLQNFDELLKNETISESVKPTGCRIIDIEILISIFSILCCPSCAKMKLYLEEDSRFGLCSNFALKCQNCTFCTAFSTSIKNNKNSEINTRFVYGLRLIGKGYTAGKKFCATLNIPFLSKLTFRRQEQKLLNAAVTVAKNSMNSAANCVISAKNPKNEIITSCGVSVDGTWQRRGYSSLNGVVSVISIVTGKILDIEIMSQLCRICNRFPKKSKTSHTCANHSGSSSNMEVVGAYRIFERSEKLHSLHYTEYYGDGDSKGFESVKNMYGNDSVKKLECIGHIQKRVGSHLRKLKSNTKGIGGKGKLTDNFINKLQNYYGIAIRANVGNLLAMQSATIAAFAHCCSNKNKPMHGQCPKGAKSWCKYQQALASGKTYKESAIGLPQEIIKLVKPVYMKLCDQKLLNKCLHGKTQNANESFNAVLWTILPKNVFVESETLRLGSYLAAIQYNDGFHGLFKVIQELEVDPG